MDNKFSERLAYMRRELKIGRPELAKMLGVSENQIVRYEAGKNDPSGDTILRAAQAFGVSTDFMLGSTEPVKVAEAEDRINFLRIGSVQLYHTIHEIDRHEYELIRDLRAMDAKTRENALTMLRALSKRDSTASNEPVVQKPE